MYGRFLNRACFGRNRRAPSNQSQKPFWKLLLFADMPWSRPNVDSCAFCVRVMVWNSLFVTLVVSGFLQFPLIIRNENPFESFWHSRVLFWCLFALVPLASAPAHIWQSYWQCGFLFAANILLHGWNIVYVVLSFQVIDAFNVFVKDSGSTNFKSSKYSEIKVVMFGSVLRVCLRDYHGLCNTGSSAHTVLQRCLFECCYFLKILRWKILGWLDVVR